MLLIKYRLENDLKIPVDFYNEAINRICPFDAEELMRNMNSYFIPVEDEPIFFFTKEMSDEFIGEAVEFCVEEVKKLRNNEPGIDMLMYAWKLADPYPTTLESK